MKGKKRKDKNKITFSVILWHALNSKYRVKYGNLESFPIKKLKINKYKSHPSSFFQKPPEKHVYLFTWPNQAIKELQQQQ